MPREYGIRCMHFEGRASKWVAKSLGTKLPLMPHRATFHQMADLLGQVLGMIPRALQSLGHEKNFKAQRDIVRPAADLA